MQDYLVEQDHLDEQEHLDEQDYLDEEEMDEEDETERDWLEDQGIVVLREPFDLFLPINANSLIFYSLSHIQWGSE